MIHKLSNESRGAKKFLLNKSMRINWYRAIRNQLWKSALFIFEPHFGQAVSLCRVPQLIQE